jgi:hypothetical protein
MELLTLVVVAVVLETQPLTAFTEQAMVDQVLLLSDINLCHLVLILVAQVGPMPEVVVVQATMVMLAVWFRTL